MRHRLIGTTTRGASGIRQFAGVLMMLAIWLASPTAQQPPAAPAQPTPAEEALRVRFSVVVSANQTVATRVLEFMDMVARRNEIALRFSSTANRATRPELELVLLFEKYPKMPWSRRDLGTVNLRINADADRVAVEYCLRRCTEPDAELVVYTSTLNQFLTRLDAASAALARRLR